VVRADVLQHAERPARAQHPAHLGETFLRVVDAAEDQAVVTVSERPVTEGQRLGPALHEPGMGRPVACLEQRLTAGVEAERADAAVEEREIPARAGSPGPTRGRRRPRTPATRAIGRAPSSRARPYPRS